MPHTDIAQAVQWVRSRAYRAQLAQVWPERDTPPDQALGLPWMEPGSSDGFTGREPWFYRFNIAIGAFGFTGVSEAPAVCSGRA